MIDLRHEARALLARTLAMDAASHQRLVGIATQKTPVLHDPEKAAETRGKEATEIHAAAPGTTAAASGPQVAVIPLKGLITPGGSFMSMLFGGGGGLSAFRGRLSEAVSDNDITSIILDVDSPGGRVDQVPETAALIRAAAAVKPIKAVSNTLCASAAYWLASQCDELVVTTSGAIGSIGVYRAHEDWSKYDEELGVTTTLISAGKYKIDGNPFEPLSESAREAWQASVDYTYDQFCTDVAQGRNTTAQAVKAGYGEGRVLDPEPALAAGLADRVLTLQQLIAEQLETPTSPGLSAQSQVGQKVDPPTNRDRLMEQFAGLLPPL